MTGPTPSMRLLAAGLCCIAAQAGASRLGAQAPACDRACLTGVMDSYLAALVAHDPAKAPLARDVRFTENTGVLSVGEGLWVGASAAPSAFRLYVPDPATDQVALIGTMKEFDSPVLVALRLRVLNRRVVEAEHVVVRSLTEPGLKNLLSPRPAFLADVPAAQRGSRAEMLRIADSYYDAVSKGTSASTSFAGDCVRHENGLQTSTNRTPVAPPGLPRDQVAGFMTLAGLACAAQVDSQMFAYITSIDLRRVQVVDEQKGLVFGLSMFRHLGRSRTLPIKGVPELTSIPMNFGPIDLQAAHVFKIAGGAIHEIEAIGYTLPYKSRSGWDR